MADQVYEFRVADLVGPVTRSALPELTAHAGSPGTVLTGRAAGPTEFDGLLRRLGEQGLSVTHIVISTSTRWCPAGDDGGELGHVPSEAAPQHGPSRSVPGITGAGPAERTT
jgi:hypothetical protein